MINAKTSIVNMINSPVRRIGARAELYNGSALVDIFNHTDKLQEFTVERIGEESKFFGFGVCQKLNVKLIDRERALNITTANTFEIEFGVGSDYIYPYPFFKVTEVHRDENTNALSVTAYDAIHEADKLTVADLELNEGYTLLEFSTACARALGVPLSIGGDLLPAFALEYAQGANFGGTESVREALNDLAEATQTIYFINSNWELTFKRLDKDGDAVLTIGKDKYITLDSKTNRRLASIVSATELGDNVSASLAQSGSTQYVRDNAFWTLREDIAELVENAVENIGGLTMAQFTCDNWRGNFLLEIGDKIDLVTKDDGTATGYVLNDVITYNGFLSESTQWSYTDNDGESLDNPSTLGEALKQTYAHVDKQNKKIKLAVEDVAALQLTTDGIAANVSSTNKTVDDLTNSVSAKMSAEEVSIVVKQEIASGVNSVVTEKGYTFSDEGLRISQSGSQMESLLDEDGLKVYRDGDEVLAANNEGVTAINVNVKTYLVVGENSRFENYGSGRTGCFWIG